MCRIIQAIVASKLYYSCNLFDRVTLRMEELSIIEFRHIYGKDSNNISH